MVARTAQIRYKKPVAGPIHDALTPLVNEMRALGVASATWDSTGRVTSVVLGAEPRSPGQDDDDPPRPEPRIRRTRGGLIEEIANGKR